MDKVLILTENVGGIGHFGAALSLKKGLNMINPDLHVEVACGLPYVSKQLAVFLRKVYLNTLKYAPALWGMAYAKESYFSQLFSTPVGKMIGHKLKDFVERINPQVIVCTHAFCIGALAYVRERTRRPFRIGVAITDFDVNGFWVHPEVDFYLVAHSALIEKINRRYHIPEGKIFCTGIPIDPAFSVSGRSKHLLRIKLNLDPDRFTVLIMGGGMGMGPVEECINIFREKMPDIQLIVVTGKNRPLYERLRCKYNQDVRVCLFGFIEDMAAIMKAADIVVSKAGGLTSSEALATGLPILICQPIPGQEERNSRFLLEQQVAIRQDQPSFIPRELTTFVQNKHVLHSLSEQALKIGKPYSSFHGAEVIINHL
ncbi:glycosyltransferase [Paenactinomyces guangxiensis]|uniref:Glycosyltransferase n=1 Tax=Paenactinomyces guangxiensis TaxID=1490290 RepID=A0A7W2A987_9BACL|nr:glycosyltransferase [Paenactinomyces guangxiensis]MBA4494658.1 glycosyltransferase [Paenactinomyces guangxiensis]MBH8591742.1 glycosyltransferase [Paenactinomyces guangxiensis]